MILRYIGVLGGRLLSELGFKLGLGLSLGYMLLSLSIDNLHLHPPSQSHTGVGMQRCSAHGLNRGSYNKRMHNT